MKYMAYSPRCNCRVYALIEFSGPEVVIFPQKPIYAYWHPAPRPSHTRLKRYTPIVFSRVVLCFLNKGPRAQRAENFEAISYTLNNMYALIEIRA